MNNLDRLFYEFGRNLRNRRYRRRLSIFLQISGLVTGGLVVGGIFFSTNVFNNPTILGAIASIVIAPLVFFRYLDTAGDKDKSVHVLRFRLQELESKLESREANISKALKAATDDAVDLPALAKQLRETATAQASKDFLDDLRSQVEKSYEQKIIADMLEAPQKRLEQEIAELRRRSNVNLFFGIVLGLGGLGILGWAVVRDNSNSPVSNLEFFRAHVPRISLGLLVEFLAYFFLRLYKAAATEVRYYHNELTNHESRMTAVELARIRGENTVVSTLITGLLATERNFILSKDQTTAEIEGKKLEVQSNEVVIRSLTDIIKNFSPNSYDGKKA